MAGVNVLERKLPKPLRLLCCGAQFEHVTTSSSAAVAAGECARERSIRLFIFAMCANGVIFWSGRVAICPLLWQ